MFEVTACAPGFLGSRMKIAYVHYGDYTPKDVLTPLYEYSQAVSGKCDVAVYVRAHRDTIPGRERLNIYQVCRQYWCTKITHIAFIVNLIRLINKENFDIIHVFSFPGCSLLPLFCRRKSRRWIIDIQSGCIFSHVSPAYDKLTALEAGSFDNIFVLSKALTDKLFGPDWHSAGKITVVPLGANIKRISRAARTGNFWKKIINRDPATVLLYLGTIDATRRIECLLEAFRILALEHAGKDLQLVILGGRSNEITRLRSAAAKLGIQGAVTFPGKVPYVDVPDYLANAHLALAYVPKGPVYDAQPPLKTLEYLAASLPVVATNTLGNLEIIQDGYNGVIVNSDPGAYAAGMSRLLTDPALRHHVSANALKSVEGYDWGALSERLVKLYGTLSA